MPGNHSPPVKDALQGEAVQCVRIVDRVINANIALSVGCQDITGMQGVRKAT